MVNLLGFIPPLLVAMVCPAMIIRDVRKQEKARRESEKNREDSYQKILANLTYIQAQYSGSTKGSCHSCSYKGLPVPATHYIARGNVGYRVCKRHFDKHMGEHLGIKGYVS